MPLVRTQELFVMQNKFELILFKAAVLSDLVFGISTWSGIINRYNYHECLILDINWKENLCPLTIFFNLVDTSLLPWFKIKIPCNLCPFYPPNILSSPCLIMAS